MTKPQKGATKMHEKSLGLKKRMKEIAKAALALSMCLVMPLTSIPVSAAESKEMPDPDRLGSISVTYTYYDENTKQSYPVTSGNSVGLYKVADVVVDNGFKFVLDKRFADAGPLPETTSALEAANSELAEKMAELAGKYDFDVKSVETDAKGSVSFDNLEVGLYLVKQDAQGTGDNRMVLTPFLISIPQRETDGSLVYDVDAQAKPVGAAKEEVPPPTPPKPPVIPQTGQLWWPVLVLGAAGVLAICAGMIRRNRSK